MEITTGTGWAYLPSRLTLPEKKHYTIRTGVNIHGIICKHLL